METITATLPQKVIETDHKLEEAQENVTAALAAHRWHWTLDASNPDRVSPGVYARAVGRAKTTIQMQANGYAAWVTTDGDRSLTEAIQRANVGVETEAALDAVASARGLSFEQVRKTRSLEVRRVRQAAQDAAERKGTSATEEAPAIAAFIVKTEQADQQRRAERKTRLGVGYIAIEGRVLAALRDLEEAVREAGNYQLPDDEQQLLKHTINQVRELLQLLDKRVTGALAIDWDAELAAIMEGVQQ